MRKILLVLLAVVFSFQAEARPFFGGAVSGAPGNFTTYHAYGDSITLGDFASNIGTNDYVSILSAEQHVTKSNFGVSGITSCEMAALKVFPRENPGLSGNPAYSFMIGTNDANNVGAGSYENNFNLCTQSTLTWLAIPNTSKTFATSCSQTGTWAADNTHFVSGIALTTATSGSTLQCSLTTNGGILYIWYRVCDSCAGTFTYAIDGGSPVSVNTTTTPLILVNGGVGLIRITGLPSQNHTVLFTSTNSGTVDIAGMGTIPSTNCCSVLEGGVMRQLNDAKASATSAYNTDVINNVALLSGDGLNVSFAPVRNYVNSTTDMFDTLHPNDTGHRHLVDAFESVWQAHP